MNNEVKAVYFEEQKEKNSLAVSGKIAAYKTHPCEGKKKNQLADIDYVNTRKPITYKQFKNLPTSMQKIYLDSIIERFNPSAAGIATMFKISVPTMYDILHEHGINFERKKHDNDAFYEWVNGGFLLTEEGPKGELRRESTEQKEKKCEAREFLFTKDMATMMTMNAIGELFASIAKTSGALKIVYEVEA